MTASEVKAAIGEKKFKYYFKFCVEREPVDKCISHFCMLKNSGLHNAENHDLSWERYLENGSFPIDTKKYTNNKGKLIVNRIVRFERLNEGLREIASTLRFDFEHLSVKEKAGFREEIKVTDQQRSLIYEAFAPSNRLTGYDLLRASDAL